MMTEAMNGDLGLVEPRGMNGSVARTPPRGTAIEIAASGVCRVTRISVLDQKNAFEMMVSLPKAFERLDIVGSIFGVLDNHFDPAGMNDQKDQDIDGPMTGIFKLLVLDVAGNGASDRVTFQDLTVGYLIGAQGPEASCRQPLGVGIAPQRLLGPVFKVRIQAGGFPIASPMWLQRYLMQNPTDGAVANRLNDTVGHRLAGQVMTRPVRDVQPLGYRFQAS